MSSSCSPPKLRRQSVLASSFQQRSYLIDDSCLPRSPFWSKLWSKDWTTRRNSCGIFALVGWILVRRPPDLLDLFLRPCRSVCNREQGFRSESVLDRLIVSFWGSWSRLISKSQGQIAAASSWLLIFSSSEVTLIPWLAPRLSFDRLIQFLIPVANASTLDILTKVFLPAPIVGSLVQLHPLTHAQFVSKAHGNYLDDTFRLPGRIFEVTEPLCNTLVATHLNLYVCLSGVDVCWWRWVIHCPLAAVSPSTLARILPLICTGLPVWSFKWTVVSLFILLCICVCICIPFWGYQWMTSCRDLSSKRVRQIYKLPVGGPSKRPKPVNSGPRSEEPRLERLVQGSGEVWQWARSLLLYTLLVSIDRDDGSTGMCENSTPALQ